MHQTVTGFRVLVCDDPSTDETPSVVARFGTAAVEYHSNPRNVGASATRLRWSDRPASPRTRSRPNDFGKTFGRRRAI